MWDVMSVEAIREFVTAQIGACSSHEDAVEEIVKKWVDDRDEANSQGFDNGQNSIYDTMY
jgi:hypothetical protein